MQACRMKSVCKCVAATNTTQLTASDRYMCICKFDYYFDMVVPYVEVSTGTSIIAVEVKGVYLHTRRDTQGVSVEHDGATDVER